MDLCGNDVICENVPNYPIDIIEQQLEEKQHLMHFQTEDAVSWHNIIFPTWKLSFKIIINGIYFLSIHLFILL